MRFKFLRVLQLALLGGLLGSAACTAETKNCATPEGDFQFQYVYMSGNCNATPTTHPIKLQPGELRENRSGDQVNTSVVYKGCDISLEYRVTTIPDEMGTVMPISRVTGDMVVESEEELSGVVTRIEYDQLGQAACSGEYEAVISKNQTTLGAAAN